MRRIFLTAKKTWTWLSDESGQGSAEYALILLLVAIAIIGAVSGLAPKLGGIFQQISNAL